MKHLWVLALLCLGTSCKKRTHNEGAKPQDAWNSENNPANFAWDVDRYYPTLPKAGKLSKEPWSDHYWPSKNGGIAQRWQKPNIDPWTYPLHTKEELLKMSADELQILSPAEKYDIFMARYDYPLTKRERGRTNAKDPYWWGICHAWAISSLIERKPNPTSIKNADGINIPFGASDIQAIIIAGYNMGMPFPEYHRVGVMNESEAVPDGPGSQTAANDTNAGALHIVLANYVRAQQAGLVFDRYADKEVWNHPIYSWNTKELSRNVGASPGAAPGTVQEIHVQTQITYAIEIVPSYQKVLTPYQTNTYEYILELDKLDNIIGGAWISKARPDFVWTAAKPNLNVTIGGIDLSGIQEIQNAAQGGTANPPATPATIPEAPPTQPPVTGMCESKTNFSQCFDGGPTCWWQTAGSKCITRR